MFTKTVKKVSQLGLAIVAISASPALAAPISPQELLTIYSGHSIVSDGGAVINYYAATRTRHAQKLDVMHLRDIYCSHNKGNSYENSG